jgi:hypothetical protein
METGDILVMIGSMLVSFILGFIGVLFIAGKTTLNYLKVKLGRGKKILIFARTEFGWRSIVGKKKKNTVEWKYDGQKNITTIEEGDIGRYMRQDALFVPADKPAKAYKVSEGRFYPEDFDPEVFNNLLIRALTRPSVDGTDDLKKLIVGCLILLVLIGLGMIILFMRVSELGAGGVI